MLSIRYGLTVEISVAPETVLPRINAVVSIAEKIDIPNVTRPAYMPMLRVLEPVSLPASFPAKYRAMIDSTTIQMPTPALTPGPTGLADAGLVAEPKIATPRIPNVASIAKKRNVPANIPVHENMRGTGATGYSVY